MSHVWTEWLQRSGKFITHKVFPPGSTVKDYKRWGHPAVNLSRIEPESESTVPYCSNIFQLNLSYNLLYMFAGHFLIPNQQPFTGQLANWVHSGWLSAFVYCVSTAMKCSSANTTNHHPFFLKQVPPPNISKNLVISRNRPCSTVHGSNPG